MEEESFVFYKTFWRTLDSIRQQDEQLELLLYRAIVEYGLTGDYDKSNFIVVALMQQMIFQIDRAKSNYKKSVVAGNRGGAKMKYDHDEIRKLFLEGKSKKEIAVMMGCSVRTVERVISKISLN